VNNNTFINQFSENIPYRADLKFNYTCFDRVIIRGYILKFFSTACVVLFLKAMGFSKRTMESCEFSQTSSILTSPNRHKSVSQFRRWFTQTDVSTRTM